MAKHDSNPDIRFSDFTFGEKVRIARLIAKAARHGVSGSDDIDPYTREIEKIEQRAARRAGK